MLRYRLRPESMEREQLPFVRPAQSIRETMRIIDERAKGIALVVDGDGRLLATVTDGDIRRAQLAGLEIEEPVGTLVERRPAAHPTPTTAPAGTPQAALIALMAESDVRHVPLLDEECRVVDLAVLADLVEQYELPIRAVVMAGGYGKRLGALTETLPKPMLP